MRKKMIFVFVCVLLLVVATFVACNDKTPHEGQLVDAFGVVKKPVADPDPYNERDQKYYHVYTIDANFRDNQVGISLTNAESLNNLYYTYSPQDFPGLGIIAVEEEPQSYLTRFREEYENGVAYTGKGMIHPSRFTRGLLLTLDQHSKENVLRVCDELMKMKEIYVAEPNGIHEFFSTMSTEATSSSQWGNDKINIEGAWQHSIGSAVVKVGVMDSGVSKHVALEDNLSATRKNYEYQGITFSNDSLFIGESLFDKGNGVEYQSHGTKVAGVIGAKKIGDNGVFGVCQNITMISLNVMGANGEEDDDAAIKAIKEANSLGIKILNYSAGNIYYNNRFLDAIRDFQGLFVCGAATLVVVV